jgi:hypothetical protein
MAVIMRIEGPQVISFFGIIIGVDAYLLAFIAWAAVSASILIGRYLFGRRVSYRLVAKFLSLDGAEGGRGEIWSWFESKGVAASFTGYCAMSEFSGKSQAWED